MARLRTCRSAKVANKELKHKDSFGKKKKKKKKTCSIFDKTLSKVFLKKIFLKGFQIYQNYLCALSNIIFLTSNLPHVNCSVKVEKSVPVQLKKMWHMGGQPWREMSFYDISCQLATCADNQEKQKEFHFHVFMFIKNSFFYVCFFTILF